MEYDVGGTADTRNIRIKGPSHKSRLLDRHIEALISICVPEMHMDQNESYGQMSLIVTHIQLNTTVFKYFFPPLL